MDDSPPGHLHPGCVCLAAYADSQTQCKYNFVACANLDLRLFLFFLNSDFNQFTVTLSIFL